MSLTQQQLFEPDPIEKLALLSEKEKVEYIKAQAEVIKQITKHNKRLENLNEELKQKVINLDEQFITIKNKVFGKSSEKSKKTDSSGRSRKKKQSRKKVQLPSERYPEADVIQRDIEFKDQPKCKCCGEDMRDTGLTEDSEFLTVQPAVYFVIKQKRHKYSCGKCYGDMVTAPAPKRIKEGSGYSDEMIIDVAMSKYCDLIPIDRYVQIASREGLKGLPPNSLIELTHYLAEFTVGAYNLLQGEVLRSKVIHADETPQKMLERHGNRSWYLWGFSNETSCFLTAQGTRSGDVASELLKDSEVEFLMSDVFSGYAKCKKSVDKYRLENNISQKFTNIFCNAHARRYFKKSEKFPEAVEYFIDRYEKIYRLEKIAKKYPDKKLRLRRYMVKLFEEMKEYSIGNIGGYSTKSSIGKAMSYFLKNYMGLTLFLKNRDLPIDNNHQERLFRPHVVGRKTWYGTHSPRGAETASKLFSLVESCKLNSVNPREYFKDLVQDLHHGKMPYPPHTYAALKNTAS